MSIYDRIITSVPVDKVTSLVAYAKSQSGLSLREQEIENKKEELANIEKCIMSMKNAKFISYEEKKKINYKKRALQEEMSKLKKKHRRFKENTFEYIFYEVAKSKLSEKVYKELFDETKKIIAQAEKELK